MYWCRRTSWATIFPGNDSDETAFSRMVYPPASHSLPPLTFALIYSWKLLQLVEKSKYYIIFNI